MGVLPACPIVISPLANQRKHWQTYEETMARLLKIKDAGHTVVSILGCEFRKILAENPGLENELSSHPYLKNAPLNIRDALYGGRIEATKTHYRVKQGEEIRYVDVISLYPYICKLGKCPWATRKCTWVQTVPLTVWIGRVLLNVRFCLLGNCIIQFLRTKVTPN
jgi:hypothetical protein